MCREEKDEKRTVATSAGWGCRNIHHASTFVFKLSKSKFQLSINNYQLSIINFKILKFTSYYQCQNFKLNIVLSMSKFHSWQQNYQCQNFKVDIKLSMSKFQIWQQNSNQITSSCHQFIYFKVDSKNTFVSNCQIKV